MYGNPKAGTDLSLEEQADVILRAHAKTIDLETGKVRGIGGADPILFAEHIYARKRREIYPKSEAANGTVDPSIHQGIYNRTHPEGRKVNSLDQRKRNGASWYRNRARSFPVTEIDLIPWRENGCQEPELY